MFGIDETRPQGVNGFAVALQPDADGRPMFLGKPIPPGPTDVHYAFSNNQIVSKTWLVDKVYETLGGRFGTVYVLGGWYGVLSAMVLNDARFDVDRVVSIDIDPECAAFAERLNARHLAERRFRAVTADVCAQDFSRQDGSAAVNLAINTSCEHMPSAEAWYGRLPAGILQAFQSNDYFDCPEHVNCIADLDAFKRQVPMTEVLYEGTLQRKRYSRFMLVGRK